jgi:uncharacterized membrane protein
MRWPHPPLFLLALLLLGAVAVAVLEVRAVGYAFTLTGISSGWAAVVLLASLVGSAVNVPVARIAGTHTHLEYRRVRWWGVVHLVPVGVPDRVVVAVNVGGAVVPTLVSAYLIAHTGFWRDALLAVAVVAVILHLAARPVTGVGIAVPLFLPALLATGMAMLLAPSATAPALAYVTGSLGTLIGADLSHARGFRRLDAPVLSIGGGGTFDGIFVSGVLAVLLAALL